MFGDLIADHRLDARPTRRSPDAPVTVLCNERDAIAARGAANLARNPREAVVGSLTRDLQAEFPGRNGFSARNLWNMRDLCLEYSARPELLPLVAEISWAKNLAIMARWNRAWTC